MALLNTSANKSKSGVLSEVRLCLAWCGNTGGVRAIARTAADFIAESMN